MSRIAVSVIAVSIKAKSTITVCVLTLTAIVGTSPASAQTVLFEGARLIVGDGSAPIENAAVLVERGLISRIARAGEIAAPAGATRIDLAGKTIMPAIIATHVHPGFQRGLTYRAENFTRETIVQDLNRALYFGVSTVMSQGIEQGEVMYQIRADQAEGRLGGAQLLLAGRGMGAPNAGPGNPIYAKFAYEVTTEEQARSNVRELVAKNVNAIKIWVDDRGGRAPRLPIAIARAVIDEAHKAGLKVAAHIFYHDDALALAEAHIDSFAHLVRDKVMSDELIALTIKNRVYVMPNIGSPERGTYASPARWLDEPYLAGLLRDTVAPEVVERIRTAHTRRNPAVAERNAKNYAILKASVAKLGAAGALVILGSDTGLEDHVFGYAEQKELALMVEAGMTPAQVITAATSRAAEYLGVSDRGLLAAGKRADLLVLDGNPLDDIRSTRRIARMYIGGAEVDRGALKAALTASAKN